MRVEAIDTRDSPRPTYDVHPRSGVSGSGGLSNT